MDYGAIVQVIAQIAGEFLANGEKAKAEALLERARMEFDGIELPSLEEIQAQQVPDSGLASYSADPTLEAAQNSSLSQIGDVADNGLAAVDKATLNRIANQVARRQKAGMAGIESDMAARGLAGSGMDYALRAGAASDANQRLSEEGQNIGADSLERRLKAAFGRGDMAGRMRGQQFDEASKKAEAQDVINRFNASARGQANAYNAGLPQQRFANAMQKAGAKANPTAALAANYNNNANDTRNAAAGYGAAGGQFVNSVSNNNWGDSNYGKEDLSDDENKRRGRKLYEEDDK